MKWSHSPVAIVVGLGLLLLGSGCGGGTPRKNPEEEANKALEAIQRMADAVAKDPNGPDVRAAVEDFRSSATAFDPHVQHKQAIEIRQIYRQQIQGKYRGDMAQQVQGLISGMERRIPAEP
jgi:hypothetical protein